MAGDNLSIDEHALGSRINKAMLQVVGSAHARPLPADGAEPRTPGGSQEREETKTGPWRIEGGKCFWNDHLVKGSDASTFEPLNETWARDSRKVYCQSSAIKGADVGSFRVLNPLWALDAGTAYYTYGRIAEADPSSFRALDDGILPQEKGYDDLFAGFAADSKFVFFYLMTVGKPSKLPKADPGTFEVLGPGLGRDRSTAYHERHRIAGANAATMVHLGGRYSADGERVFYGNVAVEGADPASFVVSQEDFNSAQDRLRNYSRGRAV